MKVTKVTIDPPRHFDAFGGMPISEFTSERFDFESDTDLTIVVTRKHDGARVGLPRASCTLSYEPRREEPVEAPKRIAGKNRG